MRLTDGHLDLWWAPDWQELPKRHWEGEVIVFNRRTGDTHVINESAQRMLAVLSKSPMDVVRLAAALQVAEEPGSLQVLRSHLDNLRQGGLIETTPVSS